MTDIVAELRRLYEAAPQGEWALEAYAGLTSGAMGYDIRIGPGEYDVIVGTGRAILDYDEREIGALIVAMHNRLPALLDAAEAVREFETFRAAPARDDDEWWNERNRLHERRRAALAALEQDGDV